MENQNKWWVRAAESKTAFEVVDALGTVVAIVPAFDSMNNAGLRAALFANAPDMYNQLCDLTAVAGRELPEHRREEVRAAREMIQGLRR